MMLMDDPIEPIGVSLIMKIDGSATDRQSAYNVVMEIERVVTEHLAQNMPSMEIVLTEPTIGFLEEPENID